MQLVLSRDEMRAFDRHAIDVSGVPSVVLMENAGRGATEHVVRVLAGHPGPVLVVCGPGNNGGDGFVVARLLLTRGYSVQVALVADLARLTGDARTNHVAFMGLGGTVFAVSEGTLSKLSDELARATVVVDALLGTGLDRDVTGLFRTVIEHITASSALTVSLDIPSGLDANTGSPLGAAVKADVTVTFAHRKLGLVTSIGAEHVGAVHVVDIGVPSLGGSAQGSARLVEASDVKSWLLPRPTAMHKGAAGRVAIIAGSPGKTGAALLVARGALRAGAGTATLLGLPETADALDLRVLEEMTACIDPDHVARSLDEHLSAADAVVIGPGLGLHARSRTIVEHVLMNHPGVVVADADALTLFGGRLSELARAKGRLVLTPHPGEMGRLLGISTAEVERDRFSAVARAVAASRAIVLLKGARTLVGAPGELPFVNPTGTPALATAGSGDVLAGILGALSAGLDEPVYAACAASFLHGLSGEHWVSAHGADRGLLAREIADGLPGAFAAVTRAERPLPV
ncbi:MAG TPA: NAD(P)H-hydrate dehydratase [Polyangiaceae bacterium]